MIFSLVARNSWDMPCCVGPDLMVTFEQFYAVVSQKLTALNMDPKFLDRNVNEGFSGGEKKRNEILQLSVRDNYLLYDEQPLQ